MFKSLYTKSGVGRLKIGFLVRPTRMDRSSQLCIDRSGIGQQGSRTNPISYPKILSKFESQKEVVPRIKFHPPFIVCSDARQAKELLIKGILKGSNPWFCPPLRDFTGYSTMCFVCTMCGKWKFVLGLNSMYTCRISYNFDEHLQYFVIASQLELYYFKVLGSKIKYIFNHVFF